MGRNLEPRCKQCRRVGEKLMLKGDRCSTPKCAMIRKNYVPGFHGPKKRGMSRKSDYGIQLNEKQKAKKEYGLSENQFLIIYKRAIKKTGDSSENLLKLLEQRLDNTVFRLGFASSRSEARQLVNHGHFKIDGERVNIPSYTVRQGETIELMEKSRRNKKFNNLEEKIKNFETPGWLNLNKKELKAKVLHEPSRKDIITNFNLQMIVEFYSK